MSNKKQISECNNTCEKKNKKGVISNRNCFLIVDNKVLTEEVTLLSESE